MARRWDDDDDMKALGNSRIGDDDERSNALTSQRSRSFDEVFRQQESQADQSDRVGNSTSLPKIRFAIPEDTAAAGAAAPPKAAAAAGMPSKLKKRTSFHIDNANGSFNECTSPEARSGTPRKSTHGNVALFRTRSRLNPGLDRQISRLREEHQQRQEEDEEEEAAQGGEDKQQEQAREIHHAATASDHDLDGRAMPVRRYFDALRGPELEELHDSEHALLPRDNRWPFLLRFPISSFGIVLGLGSQSILWKQLASSSSLHFIRAPPQVNQVLWLLATTAYCCIAAAYLLKMIFYLEAVRREYYHPVRVNFFFAPWIAAMFLALGVPQAATSMAPKTWTWCILMAPLVMLELKIYGQWLSGGDRRLSKVANPSTHLSVVGNFVGALLGASVGWVEGAVFFWSIGLAHHLVLFVTLYQRLPTNETLPKELHPVFFLFVAAPSAASVAWEKITGEFGMVSRIVFFIALFLFTSLVVRISFFRGFKFSIAWWAYTFPMTALSIASVRYAQEVTNPFTQVLAAGLSGMSSLMVLFLFISTILHLVYWRTLFPNDMAIAITYKKKNKKGNSSSDGSKDSSNDGGGGGFGSHLLNMLSGSNAKLDELLERELQEVKVCQV